MSPGPDLGAVTEFLRSRRRLRGDERAAFARFGERVRALEPPASGDALRSAYRGTVMATPHFPREYGHRLPESVDSTLDLPAGTDLETATHLDAHQLAAIARAAADARDRRDRIVDALDAERHAVDEARTDLESIWTALQGLSSEGPHARLRLAALGERCDGVTNRRRVQLVERRTGEHGEGVDGVDLHARWYRSRATDRPVLATAAAIRRALDRRLERFYGGAALADAVSAPGAGARMAPSDRGDALGGQDTPNLADTGGRSDR